jgi:hypothetical protein
VGEKFEEFKEFEEYKNTEFKALTRRVPPSAP